MTTLPDDPATVAAAPAASSPANEPNLSSLSYRIGTHSSFKSEMVEALHADPVLKAVVHAGSDDPTISLIDAWATALDVLTFYQERLANEGYLRTGTERRSVQELARAVGYELNPGVAAQTWLAFTVEEGAGAPEKVLIEEGTKVQSVPGPGEEAQVFETVEKIEARPEFNLLKPKMGERYQPQKEVSSIHLKGNSLGLKPGDTMLLLQREDAGNPSWMWALCKVSRAEVLDGQKTCVTWETPPAYQSCTLQFPSPPGGPEADFAICVFRLRAALFGHNAPDYRAMPDSVKNSYLGQTSQQEVTTILSEWPGFSITGISSGHGLSGAYCEYNSNLSFGKVLLPRVDATVNFDWGDGAPASGVPADFMVRWTGWIRPAATGNYRFHTIADDGVKLCVGATPDVEDINSLTVLISDLTVHGPALRSSEITLDLMAGRYYRIVLDYFDSGGGAVARLFWSDVAQPGKPMEIVPSAALFPDKAPLADSICLDAVYPQIVNGSLVVLMSDEAASPYQVSLTAEDGRVGFTLSARTTRLTLRGGNLARFDRKLRETTVLAQSQWLDIAETPVTTPITQGERTIPLSAPCLEMADRLIVVSGVDEAGRPRQETATASTASGGTTVLELAAPLQHSYRRDSLAIYANVARATHGETRRDVIGSGDGSRSFQRFPLRQAPLTFVPAATATGGLSTLKVCVGDILWEETATLFGVGAAERKFTAREGGDGKVVVEFGNGVHGARPSTGNENISATYRIGLGSAGNVGAGQLRTLMTRPLGVRGVANPLAATGGADPEAAEDAAENAPYAALTLDRIVSLHDYEDFARAYVGIGKARADWLWDGCRGVVFITVVAPDGSGVDQGTVARLRQSLDAVRDPAPHVVIRSGEAVKVRVTLRVVILPEYRNFAAVEKVTAGIRRVLLDEFCVSRREFGQEMTESELLTLAQSVEGVQAADLQQPYPGAADKNWLPERRLTASLARLVRGKGIEPAEILVLAATPEAVRVTVVADLTQPEVTE